MTSVPTMSRTTPDLPHLTAEEAARLTEFVRACKAAARAVMLYPEGHPAIAATVGRIVDVTSPAALPEPLRLAVGPAELTVDGRSAAHPDRAIADLAETLHRQMVGEITIYAGGDAQGWRAFLMMIGRAPEAVRAEGGIARLWSTTGARHITLREIDYAEVLREKRRGFAAGWERVVASCLVGESPSLSDDDLQALVDAASDRGYLAEAFCAYDDAGEGRTVPERAAALARLLRRLVDAVGRGGPEILDPALDNMAAAVSGLSPALILELLNAGRGGDASNGQVVRQIAHRLPQPAVTNILGQTASTGGTATERLAAALAAVVPDPAQRSRLLNGTGIEQTEANPEELRTMWAAVVDMLTTYSDEPFVSDAYGRELAAARTQAIEVDRISDDPPERIASWLGSVSAASVRALDLALLLDLLGIEQDSAKWSDVAGIVVDHVQDLLLVGDVEAASQLTALLVREAGLGGHAERQEAAGRAVAALVSGSMMRSIVANLASFDDAQFEQLRGMCVSLGEPIVSTLAEALSVEERGRARERLATLLLAFGATGRRTVDRLRSSPNAAVRRTAIHLLREFGGDDALPDLTVLLNDREPQVQREAVRAILNIGTDDAYHVLQQALAATNGQAREGIMQVLASVRDERAAPLFLYILRHVDHSGSLNTIYLRAVESLGALRDPEAIQPLADVLHRGEWWAPRRTATLRAAAAAALDRIGTDDAIAALRTAAGSRSRGVRAAVRPFIERAGGLSGGLRS